MKKLFRLCLTFSTLKEACKIRSVSCQSGISKKLSIISILLRDFLTSFDKIDKKNGLDVAAAVAGSAAARRPISHNSILKNVLLFSVFSISFLNLLSVFIIMLMIN